MPIVAIAGGSKYAVHADHLNTPRRLSNEQGVAAWQWKYSAFGDEKPTKAAQRFVDPDKTPGMGTGSVSDVTFNLRYPGQYADKESGLYYNYFRSYDARTGRYSQPDPIGLDGGWNRFSYVGGNPLLYTDPMGLMGGSGSGAGQRNGGPTVAGFGCMGLMCVTGGRQDPGPQFSAELSFGGGIEICDPPPPQPEPQTCSKYDKNVQAQPPGMPVPEGGASKLTMRGGLFFGPSWKKDGRFCLRLGPHYLVPLVPSLDLGGGPPR